MTTTVNPIAEAYERACTDSLRAALARDEDGRRKYLEVADALETAYPSVIREVQRLWGMEDPLS